MPNPEGEPELRARSQEPRVRAKIAARAGAGNQEWQGARRKQGAENRTRNRAAVLQHCRTARDPALLQGLGVCQL